jgi:geranylgeranyl diphosphate synthase type II
MAQALTATIKTDRCAQLAARVDRALERCLPRQAAVPHPLHEAMRYCLFTGGKRFRPLLVLASAQAVGGNASNAMPVACAIELIHAYSLVHDDLPAMDNADTRRGKPSCHRRYDEATAILVGDALLTLAFEVLGRSRLPNAAPILRELAQASGAANLIGGQMMDLRVLRDPKRATAQELTAIAQRKTAALIAASAVCGALAGGGAPSAIRRLSQFGQHLGLAFQLIDDVHDADGIAHFLGVESTGRQAKHHLEQAQRLLKPFGKRALSLHGMVQWLRETQ